MPGCTPFISRRWIRPPKGRRKHRKTAVSPPHPTGFKEPFPFLHGFLIFVWYSDGCSQGSDKPMRFGSGIQGSSYVRWLGRRCKAVRRQTGTIFIRGWSPSVPRAFSTLRSERDKPQRGFAATIYRYAGFPPQGESGALRFLKLFFQPFELDDPQGSPHAQHCREWPAARR